MPNVEIETINMTAQDMGMGYINDTNTLFFSFLISDKPERIVIKVENKEAINNLFKNLKERLKDE